MTKIKICDVIAYLEERIRQHEKIKSTVKDSSAWYKKDLYYEEVKILKELNINLTHFKEMLAPLNKK